MYWLASDFLALELNVSRRGREDSSDDIEKRRLARPVRPNDSCQFSAFDGRIYTIQRCETAEVFLDIRNF